MTDRPTAADIAVAAFHQATASPHDVPLLLLAIAQQCNESAGELEALWQDKAAGRPWRTIAAALDHAAERISKALDR